MSDKTSISMSPGLPTLLTVLFVALKLTHVISWSWWWVLSPIWISLGGAGIIIVIAILLALAFNS